MATTLHGEHVEELICVIASLDRDALVAQFSQFPSRFPVDFTPEFLARQSVDRLRHLLLAMFLQHQRNACSALDAAPVDA